MGKLQELVGLVQDDNAAVIAFDVQLLFELLLALLIIRITGCEHRIRKGAD